LRMEQSPWNSMQMGDGTWPPARNFAASSSGYVTTVVQTTTTYSMARTNLCLINQNFHASLGKWRSPWRLPLQKTRQKTTPKSDLGALFECQPTVPYRQRSSLEGFLEPVLPLVLVSPEYAPPASM